MPSTPSRFVAIYMRKDYAFVGAVNEHQRVVLKPFALPLRELEHWLMRTICPADAVVIASAANVWALRDRLVSQKASVLIAHPKLEKTLFTQHEQPEPRDAIVLARMHAAGLIPALWAPPPYVSDLRALAAHRRRLLAQRSEARATLRNLIRQYNLRPPGRQSLGTDRREWWETVGITEEERTAVRAAFVSLNRVEPLLAHAEARLVEVCAAAPWPADLACLLDIAGMTGLNAAIVLAAIGTITRFPSAGKLVGYSGLSGHTADSEHSTAVKDGRQELRAAMIDAAWSAIGADPQWRATYTALESRIGRNRAIVATARKLLVHIWDELTAQHALEHGAATSYSTKAA